MVCDSCDCSVTVCDMYGLAVIVIMIIALVIEIVTVIVTGDY